MLLDFKKRNGLKDRDNHDVSCRAQLEEIQNMQGMEYNFDETQSFDLLELDYDLKHQEKPRKHPQNPHIRIVSYVNGTIVEVLRFANVLCCVLIVEDPREIVKC